MGLGGGLEHAGVVLPTRLAPGNGANSRLSPPGEPASLVLLHIRNSGPSGSRPARPRHWPDSYLDAANRRLRTPFALKPREMRLEEGQVVVFPSYVFHEVTPFYGRDTRITVATNCWFV